MTTIKTTNRPKVSDIAQAAGVSPATVSKVINGRDGVSDETRDRVELLLEEAGFRKKLPTTKTMRSIELVVNEMTNNGSVEMVKETTSYARDFGIGITVSCAGPDFKEYATRNETSNCLRSAIERNPLGVILLLSNISSAEESLLQTRNIPYVIVDPVGQVSADALGVGIDNWTGGMLATQYLISLGHRRIAVITGPTNSQSSQARLSGYMAALQKNGISADPHLIKVGDYVSDKAYKAACDLLEMREQDRPTAIFAFNDLGAINVYRAARQHGISLPEQLLHSSHAACRTRKLRIAITAVTCNGTQNQLPRSTMHMQSVSDTSIYLCLPDENTKEATKPARPCTRGMLTMEPQQNKRLRTKHEPTNETTSRVKGRKNAEQHLRPDRQRQHRFHGCRPQPVRLRQGLLHLV